MDDTPQHEAEPQPTAQPDVGGSYLRHADGRLELLERTADPQPAAPAEDAPAQE